MWIKLVIKNIGIKFQEQRSVYIFLWNMRICSLYMTEWYNYRHGFRRIMSQCANMPMCQFRKRWAIPFPCLTRDRKGTNRILYVSFDTACSSAAPCQARGQDSSLLIRSESYHKYWYIPSIKVYQNKSFIPSSIWYLVGYLYVTTYKWWTRWRI